MGNDSMQVLKTTENLVKRYEQFWRDGAKDIASVYVPDAILCGYEIVKSHDRIASALSAIQAQGWTEISIEVVEHGSTAGTIHLACRYTARRGEDALEAKSSYVLIEHQGVWKIAMHTAT